MVTLFNFSDLLNLAICLDRGDVVCRFLNLYTTLMRMFYDVYHVVGKRGAEEVVEHQVVGNKKHKTMEETNSGRETEENIAESSQAEVSPAVNLAATTQDDEQRASISNEYKEEDKDDRFKEDHQHVETPNRSALKVNNDLLLDHPTRLDERDEHRPTLDSGSKTLFLGNLSFSIEEDDVRDFFKNVGEIAEIRFAIKDDRFKGYGYIEFTTAEAAQEALKLNREVLLGRRVSLDFARRQRGAYTPGNSMYKPNQRGDNAQVKTVYVRGFESSDGYDNIWSTLEKHFGKCGEISRLCIPKDHVSGVPKGVAFIDFTDGNGFGQALELDGSVVGGCRLTVEVARRPKREGREGSGYGSSGWSGSGGGWSGSHGGWSTSDGGWRGSGGGWSESGGVRSGYGCGRSDSGGGWSRSGGGWVRESSYSKESGSGGGWRRENGYGSSSRVESGYGSRSNTKSGPDSRWHRESGSGGGWHRGSGSNDGGFSRSRVGSGSGSSGNGYSSSSHHGREDSFSSGRYDSRQSNGP
ncbi:hypothetical protein R6Q57_029903 [Mikania cordata]